VIHRRGRNADVTMYNEGPFIPYATMFKLDSPDSQTVECVACQAQFPLSDLLQCELEEYFCPKCHSHAAAYWRRFRHRPVPAELNEPKEDED